MIQPQIKDQKNVSLLFENVDLEEDELTLVTDEMRLQQILINFVSNSMKFTPQGFIKVIVRRVNDPLLIGIDVQDTGLGMAEEIKLKLF